MAKAKEGFVQAGEYRTHYWEAGQGDAVVMMHSADPGTGGGLEYRHTIEPLSEHFKIYAVDIIGFGQTDSPKALLKHPAYVKHMFDFMDAAGIKKAHLVGNCRGGLIAITMGHEHPERVGRIILIGNAGGGIPPELEEKALAPYANYQATKENLQAMLERSYFSTDRSVPPDVFDQYLKDSARQYDAYNKLGGYPMDVPNCRPQLAEIKVPVLFMVGRESKVLPIEQALKGYGLTPGSRFYSMSNCGLHPQTEHPEEFNKLAVQYLKGELF